MGNPGVKTVAEEADYRLRRGFADPREPSPPQFLSLAAANTTARLRNSSWLVPC